MQRFGLSRKSRFLILIGGCARTGKTTLANELTENFRELNTNVLSVKLDSWLLGIDERTGKETVRERFSYVEIVNSIRKILKGEKVYPPIYDPKTRLVNRNNSTYFLQINAGICIVEGVVALDIPELRDFSDFKIYTEVDEEIRKARLIEFYQNYKKLSFEETKQTIEEREAEEVPLIKKTKHFAEITYHPDL